MVDPEQRYSNEWAESANWDNIYAEFKLKAQPLVSVVYIKIFQHCKGKNPQTDVISLPKGLITNISMKLF